MEDRGEVQCFVEVALAGGSVAADREHHGVLPAELRSVREADGVEQLGGERGRLRCDVVAVRVVAGVPVAAEK